MKDKIIEISNKLQQLKLFNPIAISVEFLISIGFIIEIFKLFTTKAYNDYWALSNLICGGILGIILLFIIIVSTIRNYKKIEMLFLTYAIPIGIAYAIFLLPLNVPDEGSHLLKANDMANGNMFIEVTEEGESLTTVNNFYSEYSFSRFKTYEDVKKEIAQETNYDENIKQACMAQSNPPLLYIGSAIAIKLGMIFKFNMLIAIYLGRILNFIIFLAFGYITIKKIPIGKAIMAVYLCIPMMLQQAASCSSDAILNAILIYYIAHILYMKHKETKISKKDKILLYILTACVAMCKFVYVLIAGVLFEILFNKKINKKERIKTIGIMILVGSVFTIGWYLFTRQYTSQAPSVEEYYKQIHVNGEEQVDFMIKNPLKFLGAWVKEYTTYGINYVMQAVGSSLGWLNVIPNMGIIILYILLLFYSVATEDSDYEFKKIDKIWTCLIIIAIAGLVQLAMYVGCTPVGLERICGVQGRYYTPILILPLLCLVKKHNCIKIENRNIKLILFSTILNIAVLIEVFQSYLTGVI